MEQDTTPAMSRQVLNAHVGMTNVIEQGDIDTTMLKTFATIKATLEDHCGPYGKYAMLVDPTNPVSQPAFTKDGINILRAMEFVSPIERYVKNTVAYIGSRVERAAGDGPQPLYAKVLTPHGFKLMGDMRVGDIICGTNGSSQVVEGVYPKGQKEIYVVTLTDGRRVECCEDHLWSVISYQGFSRTLTTKELRNNGLWLRTKAAGITKYYLPVTPVEYTKTNMVLDPYLVGLLLGDGSLSGTGSIELSLGYPKAHVIDKIILPEGISSNITEVPEKNYIRIKFTGRTPSGETMHDLVRRVGLLGTTSPTKFIPPEYLYATSIDRQELLDGLVSTDGYVNVRGSIEYSTVSAQLRDNVMELMRSLGLLATCYTYNNRVGGYSDTTVYRVYQLQERKYGIGIASVEPTGNYTDMQCIKVSNEDHLYITDNHVVTHNTTSSMIIMTTVLEYLREYLKTHKISYHDFVEAYQEFESRVLKELTASAVHITPETSKELIRAIVFHQAFTSSHGDVELSDMVADLYGAIPQEAWDYITYLRRGHETKERLVLEKERVDYVSRARIYENTMFNTLHGDGFEIDDAELYVSSDQMVNNGEAYDNIKKLLTEVIADSTRRIVICVPAGMDVMTRNEITTLLYGTHAQGRIAIFSLDADNPRINDLTCLMSICGEHYPYEPNNGILRRDHVNVEFKDFTLKIRGVIVTHTPWTDAVSPGARTEGSPVYKQLKLLEEIIAAIMSATGHHGNAAKDLKEYKRMYNNLLMSTKYTLVIGGSAYDNEAMVDVVEDALKASREALRSGVVLGGYATLKGVLQKHRILYSETKEADEPVNVIASAFYEGIHELQGYVFKHCPEFLQVNDSEDDCIIFQSTETIHAMLEKGDIVYDVNTGHLTTLQDLPRRDLVVIVQPLAVDKALIQRFGEVALKFLFTNRVVIPGGVVVNT
jgi:chaperonin GroEL (HSP60 family)